MAETTSIERILKEAKEKEGQYEWLKAADSYQQALNAIPDSDCLRKGELLEDLAYAVYKAAFQADEIKDFKERMAHSRTCYGEAKKAYEMSAEGNRFPRIVRCEAMIAFSGYWLATESNKKRTLVNDSWNFAKLALKGFKETNEALEYGRTYNNLILSLFIGFTYWEKIPPARALKELIDYAQEAVRLLSVGSNPEELSTAYVNSLALMDCIATDKIRKEYDIDQKLADYRRKANQVSERDALLAFVSVPGFFFYSELGTDATMALVRKAVDCAVKTKDNYIIGSALDMLAFHTAWKATASESQEDKVNLINSALRHVESAQKSFSKLGHVSTGFPLLWAESPYVTYYVDLAECETDFENRRVLLQKSVEAGKERLKKAQNSGYIGMVHFSHHFLSTAYLRLAETEASHDSKKQLLEDALHHEKEALRGLQAQRPELYYDQGLNLAYTAYIKFKLADLSTGSEAEYKILKEAIADNEEGLALHFKEIQRSKLEETATSIFERIGKNQYQHGDLLIRFYRLSHDKNALEKASQSFLAAAESFKKLGIASRMAESHWKAAQVFESLSEYDKAATDFDLAATDFSLAIQKMPRLKDFYRDHSLYMQAWAEIERGRNCHARQEHDLARDHFEKAAKLHESSTHWSYIAPNYSAWARIEQAEKLSREGNEEDAQATFLQAMSLFDGACRSVQTQLNSIEDSEERHMAEALLTIIQLRKEYAKARVAIENARISDNKGEHASSAKQYAEAVGTLSSLVSKLGDETDRKEIEFTILISQAWQKMAEAEAEQSHQHFEEANQLFEKAKDSADSEKMKALVLGHSHLCKALGAGTKFTVTQDMTQHSTAMQHLETATRYYVKADFQSASEYTKATRSLFDAYLHMGNAARETDPEKKARLYTIAQKLLQASADSYLKANSPSKREQVLKLLETANEQRELAYSLAEVLNAPILMSTTALTVPSPTSEKATGLEKFEHAEVNANLILSRTELKVGESVDLEIELANPGKGSALITQIEKAVPEGFEVTARPESYRVEGFNINMKGKRLDPLKAEEVKFSLRPKHKGSFTIGPTIRYVDENGNAKSHQPEPLTITVRELGIKGWIAGDR